MVIEFRAGFCDPDGELLGVIDRPDWQRPSRSRKALIVDALERVCEERGLWEVEAWRRDRSGHSSHVIGYWHAEAVPAGSAAVS
jgi:hypothetical protein